MMRVFNYLTISICCILFLACSEDEETVPVNPKAPVGTRNVIPHSIWEVYPENPVISKRPESWDSQMISMVDVVLFKDTLRMWYEGSTAVLTEPIHMGYAWSLDGLNWNRSDDPVLTATEGQWAYPHIGTPSVLVDGDTLRMWFGGGNYTQPGMAIGYATSVDGIHWERHPDKVMASTQPWNTDGVLPGPVLKEDGLYKMWMTGGVGTIGFPTAGTFWSMGYATSTDGIQWEISTDPVLEHGTGSAFDLNSVLPGTVLNVDTAYVLYYSGAKKVTSFSQVKLAMAISADETSWMKYENNPIMEKSNASTALYGPKVREFNGEMRMWYAAWNPGPVVHTATASN